MTTQELRELDMWIDRNLFNRSEELSKIADHYTTSQHYAMDVLKKCAERICDKWDETNCIQIQFWDLEWHIADSSEDSDLPPSKAETLELAICLFAKQLFSQTTK